MCCAQGFRPTYSAQLASQQLFVIEQVLWNATTYPVVSVCQSLWSTSFAPNWQTSSSSAAYVSLNYVGYNFLQVRPARDAAL